MAIAAFTISIIGILISIITLWRTLFYEKQRQDTVINAVFPTPEDVPPLARMIYIELMIANNSKLPLPISNATIVIEDGLKRQITTTSKKFTSTAFRYNSLIAR
ncbi:hypothetical protein EQG49_11050 [Periweissella cryptocerci]|uniref:Uncharacterized protein n=1 Tax=Periweissella cryptocerci TaxID=2506420 RepID=A0A4P6YW05_9LACO|nr:hypothetical protein [Periweissella cryptocerci]QBO36943.1 hypothetical protein EQG49_11050 [Periweissella cryptocerci]